MLIKSMNYCFVQELAKRLETHDNFSGLSHEEIKKIEDFTERLVLIFK